MNDKSPNFWQVFVSVCAAMFGVQNDNNRIRDFSNGNFIYFAIVGVVLVTLFVLALIFLVQLVLPAN
ncbi:DUF2970 domain-containing protein [Psychrobium sp. MM17-31]|uniref:DUF2970 domain-containing protein n=1 Tax=Psychrobium sp. MM17-31 TaxID=2917758 RepID=UPI001EF4E3EB|nr:DUF2970 domain-containing protein [Psychrobium sp. MM17-31]MCG7530621.1 DUF2970 domain-containing protein [Psychrobium sp. MM17-31]